PRLLAAPGRLPPGARPGRPVARGAERMSTALSQRMWPACLSSLQLDRHRLRELPADAAHEVQAPLDSCERCRAAATELERDAAQAELPPLRLPRRAGLRWALVAGVAAAAGFALVAAPRGERIKGSGLALHMFVQHEGQVRRGGPGEIVSAGDAVRFAVTLPERAHVAVLSLDPRGRASVYFPLGARAEAVGAGSEVALPLATRLDAAQGTERLFALFCGAP